MGTIAKYRKKQVGILAAAIMASAAYMPSAFAEVGEYELPGGGTAVQGVNAESIKPENAVTLDDGRKQMNVQITGDKGIIHWDTFDIGSKGVVNFSRGANQPAWMVLNRVVGNKASEIYGNITSDKNGTVFLVNPNGITFGEGSSVDVGSFVASTLDIDEKSFKNGNKFIFTQSGDGAAITNLSKLIKADGVVALLAKQVFSGVDQLVKEDGVDKFKSSLTEKNAINAGQVAMAAGKNITLELPYDDKISVTVTAPSNEVNFVANSTDITANKGYVLMKASDALEYGKNLVCQMGDINVKADGMAMDKDGNIVLQAETVDVGGTLNATGNNAKISILGNSTIAAKVTAQGDGTQKDNSEIYIDSKNGASVIVAGQLSANKKITTKSNHSVIVLDQMEGEAEGTSVNVGRSDDGAGWDIIASQVRIASGGDAGLTLNPGEAYRLYAEVAEAYMKNPEAAEQMWSTNELYQKFGYSISNKVLSKTLEKTNVNIKTAVDNEHHADYTEHDIVVEAPITKIDGVETTLTMTAFNEKDKEEYTASYHGDKDADLTRVKAGSIVLKDDIESTVPLNVELTADTIIVDSTGSEPRTIHTWGDTESGSVTITGKVDGNEAGKDSLKIESGNVKITGDVGSGKPLENLSVYADGSITIKGSVTADNDVVAWTRSGDLNNWKSNLTSSKYIAMTEANDSKEGKDIIVDDITAGNTVSLVSGHDVTINGKIAGGANNKVAGEDKNAVVLIVAQNAFKNESKAGQDSIQVGTAPESSKEYHWKVYSASPSPDKDDFGNLNSENFAEWNWGKSGFVYNETVASDSNNRYIFKDTPSVIYKAADKTKKVGEELLPDKSYSETYLLNGKSLAGQYTGIFRDGNIAELKNKYELNDVVTKSDGFAKEAEAKNYAIELDKFEAGENALKTHGYMTQFLPGTLKVGTEVPEKDDPIDLPDKPQMDNLTTTNLAGTASYTMAQKANGASADRVLGLQTAELPFFNEKHGTVKLYGTYDVSVDPEKVEMEPTAKVLPEPEQEKNQYRELESELATSNGTAKFKLTYNGSTLDIYPTDAASKALLVAGDGKKNEEVEAKALFAAFKSMGISLDDLDGVYTHFDTLQASSFRH